MKLRLFGVAAAVLAIFLAQSPGTKTPTALATPANDNLANAIAVITPATAGIVATGTNAGATTEPGENTPCAVSGSTVWFTWTSPGTPGTAVFDTVGSNFDTVLAIYSGSAFPLTQAACDDDVVSTVSSAALTYTANTTYRIQLSGYGGATGDFILSIAMGGAAYVNYAADNNTADAVISLREAMLLAVGGTGPSGLNRALTGNEATLVRNAAGMGAAGSDLIHFSPAAFPWASPVTIVPTSPLPELNQAGDNLSGIGAGVIVDPNYAMPCISLTGSANQVEGLRVRRCYQEDVLVTGNGNKVGGPLTIQRNVLTESPIGVMVGGLAAATGTTIKGNYIGTDGINDLGMAGGIPPEGTGIFVAATGTVIGGPAPGEGNLISGNDAGIMVSSTMYVQDSSNNAIYGNRIGTDASGGGAIPNNIGLWVGSVPFASLGLATSTQVGMAAPGYGNVIAFNNGGGVGAAESNAIIRGNSIYSNGAPGGISNMTPPVTPVPVIGSVAGGAISGFACAGCQVDVYNDQSDQGRIWMGSATADASGVFSLAGAPHSLPNITATATNGTGTSQFTAPFAAPANSDGDGIPDAGDPCPTAAEDYDGFQDSDGCPDPDNDNDGICDPGQTAASCSGSDQGSLCFDPAGTLSCTSHDCRNLAEDYDAFKDSDGCPDPDNDNDGFPDATDQCPGVDSQTGSDGMLGSPQDLNHNGVKDPSEATLTTDDVTLTFEDKDGVLDTDGCHDSPGADFDGDGFTDDNEALFIGTDAGYPCGFNSWPADLWDQPPFSANKITIQDVTSFLAPVYRVNTSPGDPNFSARWDILPGKGFFAKFINIQDLTTLITLTPPMLNGARALSGPTCPYPSQ